MNDRYLSIRLDTFEERVADRLTAMDRRIESLVGRSVPATECGPDPQTEPLALHELRAVLEYAVNLKLKRGFHTLFCQGFDECQKLMIHAIENRIKALDRRDG